jgi:hypothetical protein
MAKAKARTPSLYLPGWDNEEHVRIQRSQAGDLELTLTGACGGCRESLPDMQRTIRTIAQKSSLSLSEATAFYLGFTVGVDSVRRYHRLGDFLDDDELLEEFFSGKPVAGRSH